MTARRFLPRSAAHVLLLAMLIIGAAYGTVMLASYAVTILALVSGRVQVAELSDSQVMLGVGMVGLWGSVIVAGHRALWQQWRQNRRLLRWIAGATVTPSTPVITAARRAGCTAPVLVVDDRRCYALTIGIWHPRVVLSVGLVGEVTADELVAVLRHEHYHVQHRDPLRVLALRTCAAAFFLLPLLGVMLRRVLDRQEVNADRSAVRRCGVAPVASALLKAVGPPGSASGAAVTAVGDVPVMESRVLHLETGRRPGLLAELPARSLYTTVPGIALLAVYALLMYRLCGDTAICCLG